MRDKKMIRSNISIIREQSSKSGIKKIEWIKNQTHQRISHYSALSFFNQNKIISITL